MILRETRRFLHSSPLLSISAIGVLALGIGACAFTLSLLVAFSNLRYPGLRPDGFATIAEETEAGGSIPVAWHRFERLRTLAGSGVRLAAYSRPISTSLRVDGDNTPLNVASVSSGFFSVFTAGLSAGRDFSLAEEGEVGGSTAILSYGLASRLFASPAAALGRFVIINDVPYSVIGVAPRGFRGVFADSTDAWVPASRGMPLLMAGSTDQLGDQELWKVIAAFYALAASERASSLQLAVQIKESLPLCTSTEACLHVSQGLTADPVRDTNLRKWLRFGLLLSLIFTVISGLNYALLLVARAPRLAWEAQLKRALGATTSQLVKELLAGPAVLVGAGSVFAALFCVVGMRMVSGVSAFYAQVVGSSLVGAYLAFAVQVPLACGLTLLIGLAPAHSYLWEGGIARSEHTGTRHAGRILQALVALQVMLCMVAWILAGMTVSAVESLVRKPLGYDPSHLAVVSVWPAYGTVTAVVGGENDNSFPTVSAINSVLEGICSDPGVSSASLVSDAPFGAPMKTLKIQPVSENMSAAPRTVYYMRASQAYFRTMRTRILRGRDFIYSAMESRPEIIINQSLERELWPQQDPVNREVRLINPEFAGMPSFTSVATIVGVVEDMRVSGFTSSPEPTVFESIGGFRFFDPAPYLIVRASVLPRSLEDLTGREVAAHMRGLAVKEIFSVDERSRESQWKEQGRAYLATVGAIAMAFVAYIGLYGVTAYYVAARRRELAIRISLGASTRVILGIVVGRAIACTVLAVALSLPLWPILAGLATNDYLGVVSWSTVRALLLSLASVCMAILISSIPAVRAARISPSTVLREE